MPKLPKAELLELFFLEVASYIPRIRQGLKTLSSDNTAVPAVEELHRLFHNIKGAASQVRLADLSKGARVVESALDQLLEEGQPIPEELLTALHRTADLLIEYAGDKNNLPAVGQSFHERVVELFQQPQQGNNQESPRDEGSGGQPEESLLDVRSIFPLLHELAGCLTADGSDLEHDAMIYGKLSRAVAQLSATFLAAGMERESRLMEDFHLLLAKLHATTLPHQPEVSGLIQDFLRFLDAGLARQGSDNDTVIIRVQEQLRRFRVVLETLGQREEVEEEEEESLLDEHIADFDALDIFDDPGPDDPSIDIFAELAPSNFIDGEEAVPQTPVGETAPGHLEQNCSLLDRHQGEQQTAAAAIDDDQLLLLEIFREECEEHFLVINQALNLLESSVKEPVTPTSELLASVSAMRRAVHTLKGAASMTGVNLLARGAHSLEDLLDWLHDEAGEIEPRQIQVIATGIDVLEFLSQSPQATESARLDSLVDTVHDYLAARANPANTGETAPANPDPEPGEISALPEAAGIGRTPAPAVLPGDSGTLRVRLEDLDDLVSIEGELVVARGAMEKMVEEFVQTLTELDNVKEKLRRKSQELESGFEVQSLYGFNPVSAQGGADAPTGGALADFDPIELDRYSQLNLIIRSLNEISVDVNAIHATLGSLAGDISGQIGKQQLTMRLMQDKLMRIRMTPLSSISRVLFRTVRDTAIKLNKKAVLTVTGEDVYMDRFVWARITDPLSHLLRNAVDHGIEPAGVRAAAGKPEAGTIVLRAEQRSRYVVVRLSDDGGGIDFSLIKDKLRREGLAADPETLGEKELLDYLFHPSFTTRQQITPVSGRGVGLDVVRRNIQELRGSIRIHNTPGQGVEFEIHIPFSLSVNRAALVSVAGREFAIPLQDILQVKHFSGREIENVQETGGLSLKLADGPVPVSNLGYHLQLEKRMTPPAPGSGGILAILFLKGEERWAVAIDSVVEQREIVIKNLGSHLSYVRGISGVTLTGSGKLIPILNLRELVETRPATEAIDNRPLLPMELNEPLKVLIVDDSISVRHSVARLVESQAWQQRQAVDGVDALAKLDTFFPDVIILDIEMPRMNGYEFKSRLNNQPMYKDIPVVMLTSRASAKHRRKAGELGIDHYLTKPYQDDTFVRLLENIRSGCRPSFSADDIT